VNLKFGGVAGEELTAMPTLPRSKHCKGGKWETLESFAGSVPSTTAIFVAPAGAEIKVRYGVGFLGWDRQKQKLDGVSSKSLNVSGIVGRARMQIRVQSDTTVNYEILI
jgi:hypothetical protein